MNIHSPNEPPSPIPVDDFERRGRLISLVYEVLRTVETPADGATDMETCSALSQAFADKAIALANLAAAAPRTGRIFRVPTPAQVSQPGDQSPTD